MADSVVGGLCFRRSDAPLTTALKASGNPIVEGILAPLRELISRSGATCSSGVQMVNQRGACGVDVDAFHAVRALPRPRPGRGLWGFLRLCQFFCRRTWARLSLSLSTFGAHPRLDVEALHRLARLAAHAVLSVQPILVCPAAPAFTHDPDDNRAAKANDGNRDVRRSQTMSRSVQPPFRHTPSRGFPCAEAIDRSTAR